MSLLSFSLRNGLFCGALTDDLRLRLHLFCRRPSAYRHDVRHGRSLLLGTHLLVRDKVHIVFSLSATDISGRAVDTATTYSGEAIIAELAKMGKMKLSMLH